MRPSVRHPESALPRPLTAGARAAHLHSIGAIMNHVDGRRDLKFDQSSQISVWTEGWVLAGSGPAGPTEQSAPRSSASVRLPGAGLVTRAGPPPTSGALRAPSDARYTLRKLALSRL